MAANISLHTVFYSMNLDTRAIQQTDSVEVDDSVMTFYFKFPIHLDIQLSLRYSIDFDYLLILRLIIMCVFTFDGTVTFSFWIHTTGSGVPDSTC